MTDESFKIKSLSDLLAENNFARNQDLFKQNMYAFMLRLLEENKNLAERLADCQSGHRNLQEESRSERRHKLKYYEELSELKIKCNDLKVEKDILEARLAAKKRKKK